MNRWYRQRIFQLCGSGSGFNRVHGSGSREAKWRIKSKKIRTFMLISWRAGGFSWSLTILQEGPKSMFWLFEIKSFSFSTYFFLNFVLSNRCITGKCFGITPA
jgi:hypothetical protein